MLDKGPYREFGVLAMLALPARITFDYAVQGVKVCQAVFLFANTCSKYMLKKVANHLESGRIVTPEHGSKGAAPWNILSPEATTAAVMFIQNYGDVNGLPQPAAPRGRNSAAPIYLSCFTTKKMVHALYMKKGGEMSYRSFAKIWSKMCADIAIMTPREDVCATCSDYQSRIS